MSSDLTPFTNGEFSLIVEMHDVDGFRVQAPLLGRALGFASAKDMLRSIPEGEKGWELSPTPGGEQRIGYVTEAGFYRALGQRQAARITDERIRAAVERFQSWVYADVLPAIRRTGRYEVATIGRRELAEMVIAEADRADRAEAKVIELHPAAAAWNTLADTGADYSCREAACILNRDPAISTGQNRLLQILRDWRLIGGDDRPYANHSQHVVLRPRSRFDQASGEDVPAKPQVRVTVRGLEYLHKRLGGTSPLDFTAVAS